MHLIVLPIFAVAIVAASGLPPEAAKSASGTEAILADYRQCTGGVSTISSEGCPAPTLAPAPPRATMRIIAPPQPSDCRDRIRQVRDELGQPALDRGTASPQRPPLIAAVDKRIDGCAVLQMKGNVNDLRPVPEAPATPPRMEPAD